MKSSIFERVLMQRRLILTLAVLLSLTGVIMWITMIRQEDPRLPDFWGQIVAPYPGADAESVEQLVLEPIENALTQVDQIKEIDSTAFSEMAVLTVELHGHTQNVRKAWDDVREALQKAHNDFPNGVPVPILDEDQIDQDSIVLAVTGSSDPLVLLDGARRIKKQLLRLERVSKVHYIAPPREQVTIELDDAVAGRMGITPTGLAERLNARSRILPGGSIALGGQTVRLRPMSEFSSIEEIASTSIMLQNGTAIPLSEMAAVRHGPAEPITSRMRFNGEMSMGIAVVPRKAINLVDFGDEVRTAVYRLQPALAPLNIREVTFQPKRTATRLAELNQSLLVGILIVGGVLVTFMGLRLGLMVALIVPLVAMASVAIFALGGGVLHQISIAALVISLGMLVDNAIVIAENVQWRMDRGVNASRAGIEAVRELAVPLAGATATTLAVFVPMLISKGPTAEFTRSIPVVIMLTLTVSYVFAIFVTPNLAQMLLRANSGTRRERIGAFGGALARFSVRHPWLVFGGALLVVWGTFQLSGKVQQQFFPLSDRNQLLVDLKLPQGTHLDGTDAVSQVLESALLKRPNIRKVASFMGRSAPHFYYNVNRVPFSPHFAQLIVETRSRAHVDTELEWIRSFMSGYADKVELVARKLEQGPPVDAPVEIRLFSDDLAELNEAAGKVLVLLQNLSGTRDVRHDLDVGAPTLKFHINDAAAGRYGITRAHVAQALYGHTRGLPVGELYLGEEPIDIVVRSAAGEHTPLSVLENIEINNDKGVGVPLSQVAHLETTWRPSVIKHRNASRVCTVSSQLAEGVSFSQILTQLQPRLNQIDFPPSVRIGIGGEAEGSGEANQALMKSLPIGILLLFGVLLAEFNSFKRLGLILVTVPLAAVGVIPGLLIANQPFGFMSMLGVIALVGIVVNNAIVLIELIDAQRHKGQTLSLAIETGVRRRIRPILLTSATTIAGLLPLALSPSTLWPPLASAMISGLIASTALTLLVVPAIYRLLFARYAFPWKRSVTAPAGRIAVVVMVLLSGWLSTAKASPAAVMDLQDAMENAQSRPLSQSAQEQASAAQSSARATRNSVFLPTVTGSVAYLRRNEQLDLQTPLGPFPYLSTEERSASVRVIQPILDPAKQFHLVPAAKAEALSVQHRADRVRQRSAALAAAAYLKVLGIGESIAATEAFSRSLEARWKEMQSMIAAGRALEADGLKIQLVYEQAQQDLLALENARAVAIMDLSRTIGISGNIDPLPVPSLIDAPIPSETGMIQRALNARQDLKQYTAEFEALRHQYSAINAEYWPRLNASAAYHWINDAPYQRDDWVEGALQVSWTPFASNSRTPRKSAVLAQQNSISHTMDETRRQIEIDVTEALSDLKTAKGRYHVETRGVDQTTETLRVERRRHLQGRATTNDLLVAEAALRERITQRALARLEAVGAWVKLWLAVGEDPLWFLFDMDSE